MWLIHMMDYYSIVVDVSNVDECQKYAGDESRCIEPHITYAFIYLPKKYQKR